MALWALAQQEPLQPKEASQEHRQALTERTTVPFHASTIYPVPLRNKVQSRENFKDDSKAHAAVPKNTFSLEK